jgi:hypothetical protein
MNLDEYQWSRNPRGLHAPADPQFAHADLIYNYRQMQLGWYKIVSLSNSNVRDVAYYLDAGITPIVRIFIPSQGAQPVNQDLLTWWREFYDAGARWFEFYNEPNLYYEWPGGMWVHHRNIEGCIAPICDNWLVFAEAIINMGGYPGFPALAEAATEDAGSVAWMDAMLSYLRDYHGNRFANIVTNGMYMAAHPATLNHFYQEEPGGGPTSMRPPERQDGTFGGWHFEYPYDPYVQSLDPGRTVFGGTPQTPYGDPSGIIAMGTAFMQRLGEWFGLGTVPVVGTEGGIFYPANGQSEQPDTRYPPYTARSMGEAVVAMYNWIVDSAPPWMFGITAWRENEYMGTPAAARMVEVPQRLKEVPPLSAGTPSSSTTSYIAPPRGPGPIHGQAEFHLVILAPDVTQEWFFETARDYWSLFRPIVTSTADFIGFMTQTNSCAATVIATPDSSALMTQIVRDPFPNVYFDLLIAQQGMDTVGSVFADRVRRNSRF